jgi:hypothetical protein
MQLVVSRHRLLVRGLKRKGKVKTEREKQFKSHRKNNTQQSLRGPQCGEAADEEGQSNLAI